MEFLVGQSWELGPVALSCGQLTTFNLLVPPEYHVTWHSYWSVANHAHETLKKVDQPF